MRLEISAGVLRVESGPMKKALRFAVPDHSFCRRRVAGVAPIQRRFTRLLKVCAATQKLIFENEFGAVIDDQFPVGFPLRPCIAIATAF